MLETLRKKSRKSYTIRVILSLIVVAAILVWTKFAVFQVITGAKQIDFTEDPSSYEGKYVKTNVNFFASDYVEQFYEDDE
ncbi:MAG: hypothetical protein HFI38_13905 [Lachnospiraceae bacterium]|jgi:hypothetical protein|nr:hypothetical protein [Lachnospiraceae bacterium]